MSSPEDPAKASRFRLNGWFVVFLIALTATVGHAFGRFSYGVLLPAIRDDLGMNNTLAGFIGGVNAASYLLGTVLVSWLAGRYRLLGILRLGLLLVVAGLFTAGMAASPWTLTAALAVTGIGGALLWIPAPVVAADALSSDKRALAVGLVGSGIGVGIMLVSTISGELRAMAGDSAWSTIYQAQFAVGVVVMALVILLVRHQQEAPKGGGGIGGFSALGRMPGWLALVCGYACFGFMYLLVLGFLTTRLEDDSGWATADASFAYSLMGFAMIFGAPLFTAMAQKFGVRRVLCTAFALWPVFTGVVLTGLSIPVLMACVGIGVLFSALPSLFTLYVVENTSVQDYGASFAAATLVFGVAQSLGPPVGGLIADAAGSFTGVFVLSGLISLLGFMATWRLPVHQPD